MLLEFLQRVPKNGNKNSILIHAFPFALEHPRPPPAVLVFAFHRFCTKDYFYLRQSSAQQKIPFFKISQYVLQVFYTLDFFHRYQMHPPILEIETQLNLHEDLLVHEHLVLKAV